MIVQQLDGDDSPGIVAAPVLLLGIAKLELSVIADIPGHVVVDRVGTGTAISGLRPGAVAAEGVVALLRREPGRHGRRRGHPLESFLTRIAGKNQKFTSTLNFMDYYKRMSA